METGHRSQENGKGLVTLCYTKVSGALTGFYRPGLARQRP